MHPAVQCRTWCSGVCHQPHNHMPERCQTSWQAVLVPAFQSLWKPGWCQSAWGGLLWYECNVAGFGGHVNPPGPVQKVSHIIADVGTLHVLIPRHGNVVHNRGERHHKTSMFCPRIHEFRAVLMTLNDPSVVVVHAGVSGTNVI